MRRAVMVLTVLILAACGNDSPEIGPVAAKPSAVQESTTTTSASTTALPPADPQHTDPANTALDEGFNYWEMTATKPRDITAEVLAENEFNDPPPDGVLFVGFDITFDLVQVGPDGFGVPFRDWRIKLEGPTQFYDFDSLINFGCGVIPNEVDIHAELKEGGSVSGQYCIPAPADELDVVRVVVDNENGEQVTISP